MPTNSRNSTYSLRFSNVSALSTNHLLLFFRRYGSMNSSRFRPGDQIETYFDHSRSGMGPGALRCDFASPRTHHATQGSPWTQTPSYQATPPPQSNSSASFRSLAKKAKGEAGRLPPFANLLRRLGSACLLLPSDSAPHERCDQLCALL